MGCKQRGTGRASGAWLRADVLVRPVAEVVRPLGLGEVATGDPAGELDGALRPDVPGEHRTAPQRCDQYLVAVAGERCLRDDLRSHHAGEQLTGAAVPQGVLVVEA